MIETIAPEIVENDRYTGFFSEKKIVCTNIIHTIKKKRKNNKWNNLNRWIK